MPRKKQNPPKGPGKRQDKKKAPAKARKAAPKKAKRQAPRKKERAAKVESPVFEHLFDNPLNVKKAIYALFAVSGLSLLLDFFVTRYVDHPWEGLFGFYAVYGFVACVILVLAAKEMRKFLMRGEDYYDD